MTLISTLYIIILFIGSLFTGVKIPASKIQGKYSKVAA